MRTSLSPGVRVAFTTLLLALGASAGCSDPPTTERDAMVSADAGDGSTPAIDARVEDDGGADPDACVPSTCLELGVDCDSVDDGCGGTLECGTCTAPQTCGGDGTPNVCGCAPTTCEAEGASCETIDDGCGGTLDCGICTAPQTCGGDGTPNVCGCTPAICTTSVDCGEMDDGCGGTVDCGGCTGTDSCAGAGTPNECGCTPTTCADEGATCGEIPDGCGGTLTCGSCPAPQTCGGSGTANVCGEGPCTPTSCAAEGLDCGTIADGCESTLDCGTCTGTETCGGGGPANLCGCTPMSTATACAGAGLECGVVADGCGGTVDCGGCTAPETCSATNLCVCVPSDPIAACGARECGTVADGCGGTHACGTCTGTGETCDASGACVCTPATVATACTAPGLECGAVPDGCGGTVACGSCTAPEACSATNLCVCVPSDPIVACGVRECGTVDDGCGGTHACGTACGTGETCSAAGVCECVPSVTCGSRVCGSVEDGCGTMLDCGECTGVGESCSAAGACECTPVDFTVACAGRVCGTVANGCGGTYACGTCSGTGETCDASGACACTPDADATACAAASAECGTVVNNCGATTGSCGTCGATETCSGNECVIDPLTVGYCALQHPLTLGLAAGATGTVYGRLYVAGLTDQSAANDLDPRIVAAVGYGTSDSDPSAGGWTWIEAEPNLSYDGGTTNNDEYQAELGAPSGSYDYAYRFSGDGGSTWVYCDSDGAPYSPSQAGDLTVAAALAPTITGLDLMVLAHGATITITGTNLDSATDVSIDGAMQAIVSASPTSLVFNVDDATSVGLVRSLTVTSPGGIASTNVTVIHLVIDELDSDTDFGVDTREFVELTTGVAAAIDLTGYHLALVDGATDVTYGSFPLTTTGADGRFVIGHAALSPAPDVMIGDDTLLNGAAAAVVVQTATAPPTATPVADLEVLIDALVYGETPDTGLLDALLGGGPERVQRAEGFGENGPDNDSLQRCSPARLDGRAFSILGPPTPRVASTCP